MAALVDKGWAGKQVSIADDRKWTPMHLAAMRERILPEVGANAPACDGGANPLPRGAGTAAGVVGVWAHGPSGRRGPHAVDAGMVRRLHWRRSSRTPAHRNHHRDPILARPATACAGKRPLQRSCCTPAPTPTQRIRAGERPSCCRCELASPHVWRRRYQCETRLTNQLRGAPCA